MSVITWTVVQKALQNWVVAATGLPAASVRWGDQADGRPAYPYISLEISAIEHGNMHRAQTYDISDDALINTYGSQSLITLTITAFATSEVPSLSARQYLDDCQAYLWEEGQLDLFTTANIASVRTLNTVNIGYTAEARRISRWAMDVQFYVPAGLTKTTPDYIDTVSLTGTINEAELPEFILELE